MPPSRPIATGPWQRRLALACLALGLLSQAPGASAAPWRNHLTLPEGDALQLRTEGRRVQPSGSRSEIDVPVRVRFAKPVETPGGTVDIADAKLRILCKDGTVTISAIQPRHADETLLAAKGRKAAASAARAPLLQVLSAPAVVESLCKR